MNQLTVRPVVSAAAALTMTVTVITPVVELYAALTVTPLFAALSMIGISDSHVLYFFGNVTVNTPVPVRATVPSPFGDVGALVFAVVNDPPKMTRPRSVVMML
jgi:hypothetical protein